MEKYKVYKLKITIQASQPYNEYRPRVQDVYFSLHTVIVYTWYVKLLDDSLVIVVCLRVVCESSMGY